MNNCKFKKQNNTGLCLMVFLVLLTAMGSCGRERRTERKVEQILNIVQELQVK
jgi:hypothetical protein